MLSLLIVQSLTAYTSKLTNAVGAHVVFILARVQKLLQNEQPKLWGNEEQTLRTESM